MAQNQLQVEHWNTAKDGPLTEDAMRKKLESRGYHVSHYVYAPGTDLDEHEHDDDKIDGVISGRFEVGMHGKKVILEAGDCIVVPKGVAHHARVIGNEPVVSFDATKH